MYNVGLTCLFYDSLIKCWLLSGCRYTCRQKMAKAAIARPSSIWCWTSVALGGCSIRNWQTWRKKWNAYESKAQWRKCWVTNSSTDRNITRQFNRTFRDVGIRVRRRQEGHHKEQELLQAEYLEEINEIYESYIFFQETRRESQYHPTWRNWSGFLRSATAEHWEIVWYETKLSAAF